LRELERHDEGVHKLSSTSIQVLKASIPAWLDIH